MVGGGFVSKSCLTLAIPWAVDGQVGGLAERTPVYSITRAPRAMKSASASVCTTAYPPHSFSFHPSPATGPSPSSSGDRYSRLCHLCLYFCLIHLFIVCFYIPHMSEMSEIIRHLFFSDLFHLAQILQGPSMSSQVVRLHFLWLSSIPLCVCICI